MRNVIKMVGLMGALLLVGTAGADSYTVTYTSDGRVIRTTTKNAPPASFTADGSCEDGTCVVTKDGNFYAEYSGSTLHLERMQGGYVLILIDGRNVGVVY